MVKTVLIIFTKIYLFQLRIPKTICHLQFVSKLFLLNLKKCLSFLWFIYNCCNLFLKKHFLDGDSRKPDFIVFDCYPGVNLKIHFFSMSWYHVLIDTVFFLVNIMVFIQIILIIFILFSDRGFRVPSLYFFDHCEYSECICFPDT